MDLPPDKVKLLRQYDDEKKWDMICDQVYIRLISYHGFRWMHRKTTLSHVTAIEHTFFSLSGLGRSAFTLKRRRRIICAS